MKRTLLAASLLAVAAISPAQSKLAGSLTYDLSKREPLLGVTYDAGVGVDDLFGSGLSLTLKPFAAATAPGDGLLGGVATFRYDRLSRQFYGEVGLGFAYALQSKLRGVLYLGFGRKL